MDTDQEILKKIYAALEENNEVMQKIALLEQDKKFQEKNLESINDSIRKIYSALEEFQKGWAKELNSERSRLETSFKDSEKRIHEAVGSLEGALRSLNNSVAKHDLSLAVHSEKHEHTTSRIKAVEENLKTATEQLNAHKLSTAEKLGWPAVISLGVAGASQALIHLVGGK